MLGDTDGLMVRAIVFTGCTSAAFLVLYTVFLGSDGEFYALDAPLWRQYISSRSATSPS